MRTHRDKNDTAEVRGSFQETASRKTAENTVKHRDGGVGSVVVTTLCMTMNTVRMAVVQ